MKEPEFAEDDWQCPHCYTKGCCNIEQDVVRKHDFREIMCSCHNCDELFVRQYKCVKTIKLVREG